MWDDQMCPKTTVQTPLKCFLMTSRFEEIYRDCWKNPNCPLSKSSTKMQTAAAWTRAKFSCKLGNSLRRVHFGSVQLISNSKYLSVRTFDTVSPVNIFLCAHWFKCAHANIHTVQNCTRLLLHSGIIQIICGMKTTLCCYCYLTLWCGKYSTRCLSCCFFFPLVKLFILIETSLYTKKDTPSYSHFFSINFQTDLDAHQLQGLEIKVFLLAQTLPRRY